MVRWEKGEDLGSALKELPGCLHQLLEVLLMSRTLRYDWCGAHVKLAFSGFTSAEGTRTVIRWVLT